MEADWDVEIGGASPQIETHWPGLVDLRCFPDRVTELTEVQDLSALREALVRLNGASSTVWTSKCNVWSVGEFDPDELDAQHDEAIDAIACYIDLLPVRIGQWATMEEGTNWCKELVVQLRGLPVRCCRLDLVLRVAISDAGEGSLGITTYLTACGPNRAAARRHLGTALSVFVEAVASGSLPPLRTTLE